MLLSSLFLLPLSPPTPNNNSFPYRGQHQPRDVYSRRGLGQRRRARGGRQGPVDSPPGPRDVQVGPLAKDVERDGREGQEADCHFCVRGRGGSCCGRASACPRRSCCGKRRGKERCRSEGRERLIGENKFVSKPCFFASSEQKRVSSSFFVFVVVVELSFFVATPKESNPFLARPARSPRVRVRILLVPLLLRLPAFECSLSVEGR